LLMAIRALLRLAKPVAPLLFSIFKYAKALI
jgi:hypothetical protein